MRKCVEVSTRGKGTQNSGAKGNTAGKMQGVIIVSGEREYCNRGRRQYQALSGETGGELNAEGGWWPEEGP